MANLKASKKDIRTTKRNRMRNLFFKTRMKTHIRLAKESLINNSEDKAQIVRLALQIIDKTASKGIIRTQTASRKKSRFVYKTLHIQKENLTVLLFWSDFEIQ